MFTQKYQLNKCEWEDFVMDIMGFLLGMLALAAFKFLIFLCRGVATLWRDLNFAGTL